MSKWRALHGKRYPQLTKRHFWQRLTFTHNYCFHYRSLCGIGVYGFQFAEHAYTNRDQGKHKEKCKHCLSQNLRLHQND